MLGKLFGKKANQVKAEMAKVESRDLMQAIVGGSLLVASADGEISNDELDTLEKSIAANPNMAPFGSEIHQTMSRFKEMLDVGFRLGRLKIMREIEDIKNNPQEAEECFVNCLVIAESDGTVDEKELQVLKDIGGVLGVRLSDYGLA